ncbi:MAG: hypothetical protein FJ164_06855 [Gammaproteobacteria bacterium]|nr:hypothetical protein [Gammaproteobacteria bacterium]
MSKIPHRNGALCAMALAQGLLLAPVAGAEESEATYRSPGDMTMEERTAMMSGVSEYNSCVYKESMARVDKLPDIRQAADEGMAACKSKIDALRTLIDGYGFEPGFSEQFTHHAQSRAVRTLMPELAIRKSGN